MQTDAGKTRWMTNGLLMLHARIKQFAATLCKRGSAVPGIQPHTNRGVLLEDAAEAPNPKHQAPEKPQNTKNETGALVWSLNFGASLELGTWTLGAFEFLNLRTKASSLKFEAHELA